MHRCLNFVPPYYLASLQKEQGMGISLGMGHLCPNHIIGSIAGNAELEVMICQEDGSMQTRVSSISSSPRQSAESREWDNFSQPLILLLREDCNFYEYL